MDLASFALFLDSDKLLFKCLQEFQMAYGLD